jgi:hypothetical protein
LETPTTWLGIEFADTATNGDMKENEHSKFYKSKLISATKSHATKLLKTS